MPKNNEDGESEIASSDSSQAHPGEPKSVRDLYDEKLREQELLRGDTEDSGS